MIFNSSQDAATALATALAAVFNAPLAADITAAQGEDLDGNDRHNDQEDETSQRP